MAFAYGSMYNVCAGVTLADVQVGARHALVLPPPIGLEQGKGVVAITLTAPLTPAAGRR